MLRSLVGSEMCIRDSVITLYIMLPGIDGLEVCKQLREEVDTTYLSGLTEGWSGAELSAACNRAALLAVQRAVHGELKRMSPITREDLLQALRQIRPEK